MICDHLTYYWEFLVTETTYWSRALINTQWSLNFREKKKRKPHPTTTTTTATTAAAATTTTQTKKRKTTSQKEGKTKKRKGRYLAVLRSGAQEGVFVSVVVVSFRVCCWFGRKCIKIYFNFNNKNDEKMGWKLWFCILVGPIMCIKELCTYSKKKEKLSDILQERF